MAEAVGSDPQPCKPEKHLWTTITASEEQRNLTGRTEYEICCKCNQIKEPA